MLKIYSTIYETKGIEVRENKTTYVEVKLICQDYLNSLSKKEKRKLSYK
jgi:hypothetical protein